MSFQNNVSNLNSGSVANKSDISGLNGDFRNNLFISMAGLLCVALFWGFIRFSTPKAASPANITAVQVSLIMKIYQCNDDRIYNAIMKTFDPVLVATLIGIESNYKVDAVSPAGCRGLMQLTPNKLANWKDPAANIEVGAKYLQALIQRFGRFDLAIAAYNAGPNAVMRYRGVPPYPETQKHVDKARQVSLIMNRLLDTHIITGLRFGFSG